jgi:hypothetical protein
MLTQAKLTLAAVSRPRVAPPTEANIIGYRHFEIVPAFDACCERVVAQKG